MSGGLYAIWSAGRFLAAEKRGWRKRMFSRRAAATAKIAKMKIETRGKVPPPFFLVSNHLRYMDIAAFGAIVGCFFVAKSEVAGWFLIGRQAKNIGTVFVNRQNRRDILRAARKIFEKIENGENPVIFTEGTSSIFTFKC